MFAPGPPNNVARTTSHKVVIPFYVYAAISFLVATVLLFFSANAFTGHYFQPHILAVTHLMALGWGTMMILGASHQLVPVLIEGKLFSNGLGYASFGFAAVGIILLVTGFYYFDFGWPAQAGALCILTALICYLINIAVSMAQSKHENVHAVFVFTGTLWMMITVILGVLLVFNFHFNLMSFDSLHYLPLHAHLGILGWFLMIVIGVATRLIPMFLISKFDNVKRLWLIFWLINGALLLFFLSFLFRQSVGVYFICLAAIIVAIGLFISFCYNAYKDRLRKKIEPQIKISIASGWMMLIPATIILIILTLPFFSDAKEKLVLIYGMCIFFGWITAIIFGMTFKTLPFILWNKKFHAAAGKGKTPNPRELFNQPVFVTMLIFYFSGLIIFIAGIAWPLVVLLKIGAALLIVTSVLFITNVFKMLQFKS